MQTYMDLNHSSMLGLVHGMKTKKKVFFKKLKSYEVNRINQNVNHIILNMIKNIPKTEQNYKKSSV